MNVLLLSVFSLWIPEGFGLTEREITLSIDYFTFKNVNFVCLLVCNDVTWSSTFAKHATKKNIAVSSIELNKNIWKNRNKIDSCFFQYYHQVGLLLDTKCPFGDIMYWASKELMFDGNHYWFMIEATGNYTTVPRDSLQNTATVINVLSNINISLDTEMILATEQDDDHVYYLKEIYNIGKIQGGELNITTIGQWNEKKGLQMWYSGYYKYLHRWDFNNLPLTMITVTSRPDRFRPDMLEYDNSSPDINVVTKLSVNIFNIVAERHNIRYVYCVTDRWIGSLNDDRNSTRSGVTYLFFREADFITVLRLYPQFYSRVDYLYPHLAYIGTKFYYRIPETGVGKYENQFLTPLSPGSWSCTLAMCLVCVFVLLMATIVENRPSSAQFALFTVMALVSQQSFDANDETAVKRKCFAREVAVLVTGTSCLLLYNYYTSSVVSWLLSAAPPSIHSIDELMQSPLEVIFEDVGYTKSWLQIPGYYFNRRYALMEEKLRVRVKSSKKAPIIVNVNKGIEMIKSGGYAFHAQTQNANDRISKTFDKTELCKLGSLKSMPYTPLYPAIPKKSPFKEFFVWSLNRLNERGFISYVQKRLASKDISCDGSIPRALALGGAAPAFALLALGFLLSLVILVVEILLSRISKRNKMTPYLH